MNKLIMLLLGMLAAGQAQAFGIGDVLSAGVNVVGTLGSAAIDKAMEDSPEEMEAKCAKGKEELDAKYKEAVARVEARSDLKPLDKEKLVRQIASTFTMAATVSNLAEQQELNQRRKREQMFTVGGVAGVLGNAAMNTPSAVMARADMAVKAGEPQAQSRSALAQTDALLQTGQIQAQNRATFAVAEGLLNGAVVSPVPSNRALAQTAAGGTPQQQVQIDNAIQRSVAQHQPEMDAAKKAIEAAKPEQAFVAPEPASLLVQDRGRKVFVEFVGGKVLTERLQSAFKDGGYTVVDNAKDADVVYQFDGEYSVDAAYEREGLTEQLSVLTDNPHVIAAPQRKAGVMKTALGGFLSVVSGRQIDTKSSGAYKQQVLIVANRHFDGKDTRVSVLSAKESQALEYDALAKAAMQDIVSAVGIRNVQLVSTGSAVQSGTR